MHMRATVMSLFMAVIIAMRAFSGSAYAAETSNEGMTSNAMEDVSAEEEAPENEAVLSDDAMKDYATLFFQADGIEYQ